MRSGMPLCDLLPRTGNNGETKVSSHPHYVVFSILIFFSWPPFCIDVLTEIGLRDQYISPESQLSLILEVLFWNTSLNLTFSIKSQHPTLKYKLKQREKGK